jgi:hypothetical protein
MPQLKKQNIYKSSTDEALQRLTYEKEEYKFIQGAWKKAENWW